MAVIDPTLDLETELWRAGDRVVCGLDEVGRGSWAGPVTVGAVVPGDGFLDGVRDSKLMRHDERVEAAAAVWLWARAAGVGHASSQECDELGMTEALRRAGSRALDAIAAQCGTPDRILLDGKHDYLGGGERVRTVVRGDMQSLAMAAASVIAKVERDALMEVAAEHYPVYEFEQNRGYPAPVHQLALRGYGACAIHRRSWVFMDALPWPGLRLVRADDAAPPALF